MGPTRRDLAITSLAISLCFSAVVTHTEGYSPDTLRTANRLYMAMTAGVPLLPDNSNYAAVLNAVEAGNLPMAATTIADPKTGAREFYDVLVPKLVVTFNRNQSSTPWRNNAVTAIGGTDVAALLEGIVRDGLPLSQWLTADLMYYGNVPALEQSNDTAIAKYYSADGAQLHYVQLWATASPRDTLVSSARSNAQVFPTHATDSGNGLTSSFAGAGILNSQAWSENYSLGGTNRRHWLGYLNNLYCINQAQIQNVPNPSSPTGTIPDRYVGRDVARDLPNDQYETSCRTCHAQMDAAVRPVLRHFDYLSGDGQTGRMVFRTNPFDKSPEQPFVYPDFDLTTPEAATFTLFFTDDQNQIFGFRALDDIPVQTFGDTGVRYMQGHELADMGRILAASSGFYSCMVERAVAEFFLKKNLSMVELTPPDWAALEGERAVIQREAALLQSSQNFRATLENLAVEYAGRP